MLLVNLSYGSSSYGKWTVIDEKFEQSNISQWVSKVSNYGLQSFLHEGKPSTYCIIRTSKL